MASDLISRSALLAEYDRVHVGEPGGARKLMVQAPAVDAIPIDTVAEMLAGMYGDCCPCNYLDIDEGISVDCKRKNCPGFFETDYSCWKKYIKYWMVKKNAVK